MILCFHLSAVAHLISVLPLDCSKYAEDFVKNSIGMYIRHIYCMSYIFYMYYAHAMYIHKSLT